ncbi:MAG: hypothetical protein ACLQUZ_17025 [Rhizomicrobium sp.]
MTNDKPALTEQEIKEIAERRAASLKRVQEMHQKSNRDFVGKSGKSLKQPPPKGRPFRHQGR